MLFVLCGNNVHACAFHVECNATRDLTLDFLLFMFNFSTCIHMLFVLCENNVHACAFHVECNATRDLTVDFFSVYVQLYHMHLHVIRAVWK